MALALLWRRSVRAKCSCRGCEGMARNPAARPGIQLALILGLAFIESLVLLHAADYLRKVYSKFSGKVKSLCFEQRLFYLIRIFV